MNNKTYFHKTFDWLIYLSIANKRRIYDQQIDSTNRDLAQQKSKDSSASKEKCKHKYSGLSLPRHLNGSGAGPYGYFSGTRVAFSEFHYSFYLCFLFSFRSKFTCWRWFGGFIWTQFATRTFSSRLRLWIHISSTRRSFSRIFRKFVFH